MNPHIYSPLKQTHTRRALMAAALWSSMIPLVRADYQSEVLAEQPIVYYRFDDAVTTDDLPSPAINLGSVGAAGNGSYTGSFTRGVAGAVTGNTAVAFTQTNATSIDNTGSVIIPNDPALNPSHTGTNPFTIECWVKPNTNTSTLLSPVNSMSFTTGRAGYLIYQDGNHWQLRLGNKASTTATVLNSATDSVIPGQWQHLAAVYSGGASGTMTLYVDGVAVSAAVASFEANDNAPFVIGATSAPNRTFDGAVDEVAFFGSELSAARVLARITERTNNPAGYSAHVLADSPAGYWRLGEAAFVPRTPPVATNAGTDGAAKNGGYYAGSKNSATGPSSASGFQGFSASNSCLSLATANGHVSSALGLLNNRPSFTVMGWVKRGAVKSTRGGYFGQNDLLELGDASNGANIEAYLQARGGNMVPAYTFADDQWGFVVLTAEPTKSTLYLNGVQVGQLTGNLTNYGISAFNFNIGGGGIFGATGDYFRGEIDEVAVFDKALSAGRVQQLYDTALGNVGPGLVQAFPSVSPTGDIPEGQPYTLSIDPTGSPPFTYQWKVNDVVIPGATGRTYTVAAAAAHTPDPLDPFVYTVVVTNGTGSVTSDPTDVYVTPVLRWTSTDATNPGKWDVNTLTPAPLNWAKFTGGAATAYSDDYAVLFDDNATATAVTLTQDVAPVGVIFNNSTKNYTVSGPFFISGPTGAGLVKNGSGTVVIANDTVSMSNVTVNNGVLRIGDGTSGVLAGSTAVSVVGGKLEINPASGIPYISPSVVSGGTIAFTGTSDFTNSATITGAGNEVFEGTGNVLVAGANTVGGTVTINSGTVIFDGNQQGNRLAAGKLVTVNPGAVMEMRGVNSLPTGANSVSPHLKQSTLKVVTGFSAGAPGAGSHGHLGNLILDGGSVVLAYSGTGGVYSSESFQLNGNITVTGTAPSTITTDGTANAGSSGVAISATTVITHTVTVADVAAGPDLTIAAELENSDAATPTNATLAKMGPGTMRLAGAINHPFSGTTQVNEGTLEATGSIVGPLVIGSSGTIAPGNPTGSFTAGATTLSGTFACDIDGAAGDRIVVKGNMTLTAGAHVAFNVMAGGATAPYYELVSCTGTITGPLPTVSGKPIGYSLMVISGSSLILAPDDVSVQPTIAAAVQSGSEDFNTTSGGFTVSAAVSPETDWTYTTGSWRSNTQASGFGANNTSYLISPVYTVTQAGAITLTFSHRHSFEVDYDGGALDVSVNGGPFTRVTTPSFSQNPYNGALAGDVGHTLAGGEAYVGNSAGHPAFITSICTLANGVPGDTIQVRFISASDNNTAGNLTPAGWEIDSMQITGGLPRLMTLNWPFGTMQYSDNLQPPWTDIIGKGPLLIDTTLAPKRFFRLKP